jgi:hypothetical protein
LWTNLARGIEEDGKLLQVISGDESLDLGSVITYIDQVEARASSSGFLVKVLPKLSISSATRTARTDENTEQTLLSKATKRNRFAGKVGELWQRDDFTCSQSADTFEGVLLTGGLEHIRLRINISPPAHCYIGGAGRDRESDNGQRYSE